MGKVFGWVVAVLVVLFVIAMFANGADFKPDSMGLAV